jgi:hypothetical protein
MNESGHEGRGGLSGDGAARMPRGAAGEPVEGVGDGVIEPAGTADGCMGEPVKAAGEGAGEPVEGAAVACGSVAAAGGGCGCENLDPLEAARDLASIRQIMESARRVTVLPGDAAILGGVLALIGCGVTYSWTKSFDFGALDYTAGVSRGRIIALWLGIAVLGVLGDIVLTCRSAHKRGAPPWPRLGQMAAYAVGPAVIVGLLLTVALARAGQWGMVPGMWGIVYGSALWTSGVMSVHSPGILGAALVIAGALALFCLTAWALLVVGLVFGIGHIIFGIYLLTRFGK